MLGRTCDELRQKIADLEEESRVWDKTSVVAIVRERDELKKRIATLTKALRGTVRNQSSQMNEPCWCDTIAGLYCVGQPQCEAAQKALNPAKETA